MILVIRHNLSNTKNSIPSFKPPALKKKKEMENQVKVMCALMDG